MRGFIVTSWKKLTSVRESFVSMANPTYCIPSGEPLGIIMLGGQPHVLALAPSLRATDESMSKRVNMVTESLVSVTVNLSISIQDRWFWMSDLGTIKIRTVNLCGLSKLGGELRVLCTLTSHLYGSWSILALASLLCSSGGPRKVVSPPLGVLDFGSCSGQLRPG